MGTHSGVIMKIGEQYAFLKCEEVFEKTGKDVFCPSVALGGCQPGDTVHFDLMINQKGQPQAGNIRVDPKYGGGQQNTAPGGENTYDATPAAGVGLHTAVCSRPKRTSLALSHARRSKQSMVWILLSLPQQLLTSMSATGSHLSLG